MKILFLRVGIDTGCGKTLAPMFDDYRFEYIPIPESASLQSEKGVRYSDIRARTNTGVLSDILRRDEYAHYDPEFRTFTYGEPNRPKSSQIGRLGKGDYLVFYAGFQGESIQRGTCFVIGFFEIDKVYLMPENICSWPPKSLSFLENNAHFMRSIPEPTLVVAKGNPQKSRLLVNAKQLSDGSHTVLPEVESIIGFGGSVKRAVGRWVKSGNEEAVIQWLSI